MTRPHSHAALYDETAPRRPVNLSLNADLLTQVRNLTPNLSATVEALLGDFLQSVRREREEQEKALGSVIDAVNEFHAKSGFMSDEFSTL